MADGLGATDEDPVGLGSLTQEREEVHRIQRMELLQTTADRSRRPVQSVLEPLEAEFRSSWEPVALKDVLNSDLSSLETVCLPRKDGILMLYPGRSHMFLGEPESCKSWAAQIAVADCLNEGRNALYIDNEAEARDVVGHLRALGVSDEKMLAHLLYVRPEDPFDSKAEAALFGALAERVPLYISVIDGVNSGMVANGLEPNSNKDVAHWWSILVRPVQRQTEGPTILVDHVAKDANTRGDWSVGAGQKKALIDGAMIAFQVVLPFGVGRNGLVKLSLFKDRPGYLRGRQNSSKELAQMRLVSENGSVTSEFLTPTGAVEEAGGEDSWKPTGYMVRVSRAIREASAPLSKDAIGVAVKGKTKYVRTALEILVAEGYVEQVKGAHNSLLHRELRPYEEEDSEGSETC